MPFAAAPFWLSDNLLLIGIAVLCCLIALVLWFVHAAVLKALLLCLLAVLGGVTYINRDEVQTCGHTCSCHLLVDITLPRCKPDRDF